jgi:hypothetical protein
VSNNKSTSDGIGFTSLLLIAFIVLKLCNVIDWSWWWVLSPAWITAGIALLLLGAIGVLEYFSSRNRVRRSKKYREATKELYSALDNALDTANKSRSKWQERLDQMQEAQKKAEQMRKNDA